MARTKTISDEQILKAAREAFLERGPMATTAEIARRAGVSEGSIFRRHPNKHELFAKAMGLPETAPWVASLEGYRGKGDLRRNLVTLSGEMLEFAREIVPKLVMVMASRIKIAGLPAHTAESAPIRAMKALAGFFAHERELGRIRDCDPTMLARLLFSSVQHYAFSEFAGMNAHLPLSTKAYFEGLVDTIWSGISPNQMELKSSPKRSDAPQDSLNAVSSSRSEEGSGIDD